MPHGATALNCICSEMYIWNSITWTHRSNTLQDPPLVLACHSVVVPLTPMFVNCDPQFGIL